MHTPAQYATHTLAQYPTHTRSQYSTSPSGNTPVHPISELCVSTGHRIASACDCRTSHRKRVAEQESLRHSERVAGAEGALQHSECIAR
eukprot:3244631-Rhodomonas_salina.1